ncbi:PREDICTED: coiled-coil domain-containing protein 39 [Rhagoletis zephyria]|uniref:coiled-coil domain-containing protein 39 n=1 Tax=Rhagoletis zephyria TaxID=28612 RepID=UPI0008113A8A|nr:PREDICTED: coiled-coil domain-containing protein 39 [Rhagoletis zephyria]
MTTEEESRIQDDIIQKAMRAMGWDPNSEIPMANKENLCILAEMEQMVEEKLQLLESNIQTEDRLEKLLQHSKNAEMCVNQNLKLLQAHQSEVHTEAHLFKVAERVQSKLKVDIRRIDKETESYNEYVNTTEKELCRRKNAIDDLTSRVKWAKTVLLEWRDAMEDTNKGYQLIEKYFKEDQVLARQKDARRQLLHNECEKLRKELVKLYDEQKSLEQNIECTAVLYRTAHMERRQMVETWKLAVQQMLQRERDVRHNEVELSNLRREAECVLKEKKRYDANLDNIIKDNREVEHTISVLNEETSEIKEQIQKLIDMTILKENEVELLQKDLQNLSNKVQQQRMENRKMSKEKDKRTKALEDLKVLLLKLESRLNDMTNRHISAEQRLQMLEEMNDAAEKSQNEINREKIQLNGLIYRSQQDLQELKDESKRLEVSNSGLSASAATVIKNTKKEEKELRRMTEVHYEAAFKCLQFERKIIQIQGGDYDPIQEAEAQQYLTKLEAQNSALQRRLQTTEAQNKKLDYNMRNLTDVYNADNKNLQNMLFDIKEAQMYCEGGVKRLSIEKNKNQQKIVELSLLKMRIKEFENEMVACETNTYNLGKHRLQLNRTMKDRLVEIKSQIDLLNLKRKHLNDERSTLLADIGERTKHIDVLRARFELTSKLMGMNEDGTLVTATQLKVEAAQEKQMLLDEGNNLNAKVIKAEEDIKAMENTLMLLNNSNDSYRSKLNKKVDEDQVLEEVKQLQSNYCQALTQLKALRSKHRQIEKDNDKNLALCEDLQRQLEVLTVRNLENFEMLEKLQKELSDQKTKLQRAEREVKNSLKAVKERNLGKEFIAGYERELDLRELEYRNSSALNQLADMAENDDDIGPKVIRIMLEKGLKMPHLLQKTRSFASWRSDLSETSSSREIPISTTRSTTSDSISAAIQPSVVSIDFTQS